MTMNTQWKDLNSLAQQALKQRFVNQAMAQDWVEQLPQVSLRQLYSYALDPETPDKQKIIHALHTDTHTQQRYMEILQQLDAQEFVNAAAASTQAQVAEGRSPQWRYRLEAASDPLEESYLSKDIVLEKAHRGFIQMVFPNTDLLVKILNQADREVRMW
jgi:isochorismate synthase EntC